jgi:hypothetical protein
MQKRSPFTKDLIISTHLGFHAMVARGQPKTQNPNENKGVQKLTRVAFKNSYTFRKILPKSIAIE